LEPTGGTSESELFRFLRIYEQSDHRHLLRLSLRADLERLPG
jgi:hypothetical protein